MPQTGSQPGSPAQPTRTRQRKPGRLGTAMVALLLALAGAVTVGSPAAAATPTPASSVPAALTAAAGAPALGNGVYVFDPSMPQAQIQQTVDAVAALQLSDQFGTHRYALLFKPGTYGTPASPLSFQVGYYTEVAGLGANPGDVVINGTINVFNQCLTADNCLALVNFWRSVSNLTIQVAGGEGCRTATEFWAVSQAAPMRRVKVVGNSSLMDYCTAGPQFASGGFIADSAFTGSVVNGSQQQFLVRNSELNGWSNGVWNQVFAGTTGAPATNFGVAGGVYTTVPTTGVTAERPYLTVDAAGAYSVQVPKARSGATGTSWSAGPAAATSISLQKFFVANPGTSIIAINIALARGKNLLLTPGVYSLPAPILVSRPGTVVLGLGFPTLTPTSGTSAITIINPVGVRLAGVIVDAGPKSRTLVDVGRPGRRCCGHASDPTVLSDVFFRIGGAAAGSATTSLAVNRSNVVLDDIWAWRADHGQGVGWTTNTADTGVQVSGDNVTAYGLFVEHYQKTEVIWTGRNGTVVMFQNELPYDVPNQAAWQQSATRPGYPAFDARGRGFTGYGMGSYSFFNQGVDIHAATAFRLAPDAHAQSLLTVFLAGMGAIDSVVNGAGPAATSAAPGVPSTVISYP